MTTVMINPFVRYKGLEFFGTYETTSGRNLAETDRRTYSQYSGELLYRFGKEDSFYFGGRYNQADGKLISGDKITVKRFNIGGGWFMTKNITKQNMLTRIRRIPYYKHL
jgi:predicted porin